MLFSPSKYKQTSQFFGRLLFVILLTIILPLLPHAADVLPPLTDAYINSAATKYGISAKRRLQEWDKLIKQNQSKSEPEKLRLVNDFFNRIRYVSDLEHWASKISGPRQQNYWLQTEAIVKTMRLQNISRLWQCMSIPTSSRSLT